MYDIFCHDLFSEVFICNLALSLSYERTKGKETEHSKYLWKRETWGNITETQINLNNYTNKKQQQCQDVPIYKTCLSFRLQFKLMYNDPTHKESKWIANISHNRITISGGTVCCCLKSSDSKETTMSSLFKWQNFALLTSWSSNLWDSELSGGGEIRLSSLELSEFPLSSLGGSSGSFFSFSSLELAPPLPPFEVPGTKSGRASTPTRLRCSCPRWRYQYK